MRDAMQFGGDAGTVVPLGPSSGRNDLFPFLIFFCRYDLQHDFAWVTDEADHSVVLTLLKVAFLGKCDDQGRGPRGWPFSCVSDLVADCRESGDYC